MVLHDEDALVPHHAAPITFDLIGANHASGLLATAKYYAPGDVYTVSIRELAPLLDAYSEFTQRPRPPNEYEGPGIPISNPLAVLVDGAAPVYSHPEPSAPRPPEPAIPESTASNPVSDESKQCVVCLDRVATHILLPCAHYSYCDKCVAGLVECAVCRTRVADRKRVYQ